jgi:hypothetical protein
MLGCKTEKKRCLAVLCDPFGTVCDQLTYARQRKKVRNTVCDLLKALCDPLSF